jgi:hypothetical protein
MQRLDDLLLARATEGLDAAEAQELGRLLAAERDVDTDRYDRAAAAVCLAVLGRGCALPSGVRARLERTAAGLAARAPKTQR